MKQSGYRGSFASGFRSHQVKLESEINVTPMVDVMLVLLIIFMVSAPMMTVGLPVDLPQAALSEIASEDQPLTVVIAAGGIINLGDVQVSKENLASSLAQLSDDERKQRVRIRADRTVTYDDIMLVMSALTENGFARIGLMATPKQDGAKP